jgi:isopentenyl-diphosphate delta-isomerase
LHPLAQVEYRADVGAGLTEHELVDVFLAEPATRPAMQLNPEEVAATDWLTLAEIEAAIAADPARFTPWLKLYLTDHRAELFGEDAPAAKLFGGNAAAAKTLRSQGQRPG